MVTLYTIHCPNCKVLERALDKSTIEYEMVDDTDKVVEKGRELHYGHAPFMIVDGELLDFAASMKFVKEHS